MKVFRTSFFGILWVDATVDGFDSKVRANGSGVVFFVKSLQVGKVGELFEVAGNTESVTLYSSSVVTYILSHENFTDITKYV